MAYTVTYLPGDGIGPEIMDVAISVMREAAQRDDISLDIQAGLIGGKAIEQAGCALPDPILGLCDKSDAILLGAVGGPEWNNLPIQQRPEVAGLLKLRKAYNFYASICPLKIIPELAPSSSLKNSIALGSDILIIRELTGGLYFGNKGRNVVNGVDSAYDELRYDQKEIERIGRIAFDKAMEREKRVCSVDKSSILESSRLWRETMTKLGREYPEVALTHMSIDHCIVSMINDPKQFDIIVADNVFGDILSDIASGIAGSLGIMPTANLNGSFGLYEPCHGAASDIAGMDIANPIALILCVAMMFRYSLGSPFTAKRIEVAVENVLKAGYRTHDIAYGSVDKDKIVGTKRMGNLILSAL